MPIKFSSIMISTEGETPTEYDLEVTIMALSNLFGWSKKQRLPLLLRLAAPVTNPPRSLPLAVLPAALTISSKI